MSTSTAIRHRVSCVAISCSSIRPLKYRHSFAMALELATARNGSAIAPRRQRDETPVRRQALRSRELRARFIAARPRGRRRHPDARTNISCRPRRHIVRNRGSSSRAAGDDLETAAAIFAANPEAFTRGNPDLIKEGRSITIPMMTRRRPLPGTATPAYADCSPAAASPTATPVQTAVRRLPAKRGATAAHGRCSERRDPEAIQPMPAAVPIGRGRASAGPRSDAHRPCA